MAGFINSQRFYPTGSVCQQWGQATVTQNSPFLP